MMTALASIAALIGAAGLIAKFAFGIQVVAFLKPFGRWLTGKPEGRFVLVALLLAAWSYGMFSWGSGNKDAEWRAKAHEAEIATLRENNERLEAERQFAYDRAEYAEATIRKINEQRAAAADAVKDLEKQLSDAKTQSTQPGAKHDPNAFLDDRGRYTVRGARSVRPNR